MNILHWILGFLHGKKELNEEETNDLRSEVSKELNNDTVKTDHNLGCLNPTDCGLPNMWHGIYPPTCYKCGYTPPMNNITF